MASNDRETPRITIEVESELKERLHMEVRHGLLKPLLTNMIKDFLQLCEDHDSNLVIAAIISNEINLEDIIQKQDG